MTARELRLDDPVVASGQSGIVACFYGGFDHRARTVGIALNDGGLLLCAPTDCTIDTSRDKSPAGGAA